MGALLVQTLVNLLISLLVFINAFAVVWPSYAMKMLEAKDSPLGRSITNNEGNLIASIVMLGSVTTIIPSGYVNDKIGRKRTVILTGLCITLAWSIIATSKTVIQLIIGRFILGVAGGFQIVSVCIFVSEISHISLRGPFLTFVCSFYNIGALASYVVGWFCSYEVINYLNLTIAVGFVIAACFLKETPPYLLSVGKEKEAMMSLQFYRGSSIIKPEILDEFEYIRIQQRGFSNYDDTSLLKTEEPSEKEKLRIQDAEQSQRSCTDNKWQILKKSKPAQRAIILLCVEIIMSVCVGMVGIQTYAGPMFQKAVPNLSPDLCSVILAIVMSIAGITSVFITNLVPRRVLMITTCIMSSMCLFVLASLLRWAWAPEWAIPMVILFYCVSYQVGVINVPFIQAAECAPLQLKSLCTTATMFSMFMANFIVLLLFQPAVDVFGLDGVFLVFAIIGIGTAAITYFFARESRTVSPEIIYKSYEKGYLYRGIK